VKQCSVRNTAVVLHKKQSVPQLRSFAAWLPKHAQLVRSIHAHMHLNMLDIVNREHNGVAMGQQLQKALRATAAAAAWDAATQPSPAAAAAAAAQEAPAAGSSATVAALAAPCRQQQQRWRLASFSCNVPGAAGMLAALPAHSLTHLELGLAHSRSMSLKEVPAALVRLSSLQQLKLAMYAQAFDFIPGSCLTCLAQLTQLTRLELGGCVGVVMCVQQLLHQPLPQLQQLQLNFQTQLPVLDLAHLTQLQRITGDGSNRGFIPAEGSMLPAQLRHLQLTVASSGRALASVLPLQQLQHLDLLAEFLEQQPLLQLAQLPALQHLTLRYRDMCAAAKAAEAWAQLPQLCELLFEEGDFGGRPPSEEEMDTVVQGVAGCTGLTKLVLFCNVAEEDFEYDTCYSSSSDDYSVEGYDPYGVSSSDEGGYSASGSEPGDGMEDARYSYVTATVCEGLAGLAGLQDLTITCGEGALESGDALALTALTGLTRLHLESAHAGLGTYVARALSSSLTELLDLTVDLCDVDLDDAEFLAGLGRLTQLTGLKLHADHYTNKLTRQGLMQLTGLRRLQELHVQKDDTYLPSEMTEEVLAEFWAAVRLTR
jgi:hypothetical protein